MRLLGAGIHVVVGVRLAAQLGIQLAAQLGIQLGLALPLTVVHITTQFTRMPFLDAGLETCPLYANRKHPPEL